jgi:hypothetical protein
MARGPGDQMPPGRGPPQDRQPIRREVDYFRYCVGAGSGAAIGAGCAVVSCVVVCADGWLHAARSAVAVIKLAASTRRSGVIAGLPKVENNTRGDRNITFVTVPCISLTTPSCESRRRHVRDFNITSSPPIPLGTLWGNRCGAPLAPGRSHWKGMDAIGIGSGL